ncbi:hypothetical protein OG897_09685 [Streptomyces sp. NBC_00237]|nr:hypothetical protein [Streptomyces sp. NBC_00237]
MIRYGTVLPDHLARLTRADLVITAEGALGRGGEFLTDATERALRTIRLGVRTTQARVPQTAGTQRPPSVR